MTSIDDIEISSLIGNTLYVTVGPDRVLEGVLVAIDCHANQLLDKVREHNDGSMRELGLVSVPWDSVVNVRIGTKQLERLNTQRSTAQKEEVQENKSP